MKINNKKNQQQRGHCGMLEILLIAFLLWAPFYIVAFKLIDKVLALEVLSYAPSFFVRLPIAILGSLAMTVLLMGSLFMSLKIEGAAEKVGLSMDQIGSGKDKWDKINRWISYLGIFFVSGGIALWLSFTLPMLQKFGALVESPVALTACLWQLALVSVFLVFFTIKTRFPRFGGFTSQMAKP